MAFNNKKIILIIVGVIVLILLFFVSRFYYLNLRGLAPALSPAPTDITKLVPSADSLNIPDSSNTIFSYPQAIVSATSTVIDMSVATKTPIAKPGDIRVKTDTVLKLPSGFSIGIFAKDLPGARVLAFDAFGNLWVSQTRQGIISRLSINNGRLSKQEIVFKGLDNPHGLAFDPQDPSVLYITEETKISKTIISNDVPGALQKVIGLPSGSNHFTRTLGFGPDERLYVSIGSTCNVCQENDQRYASIYSLKKDGSDWRQTAKGLRNSVFFVWNKEDGKLWATEMGRDLLGDDTPPDEINVIDISSETVPNFGWPICYGQNIHDDNFDKNTYFRNPCMTPFESPSRIDLQAHSAPLGLAFVQDNKVWSKEYQGSLLVAFHGSWNRNVPTGYKVVRLVLDDSGNLVRQEDFVSGWLVNGKAIGRPVDLTFDSAGMLYISDDKAGVVYVVIPDRT